MSDKANPFQLQFQQGEGNEDVSTPELLKKLKGKAWEQFLQARLPDAKDEAFAYMQLKPLLSDALNKATKQAHTKEKIAAHVLDECQKSHLVFINGYYHKELSDIGALAPQVVVADLLTAAKTYGTLIQNQFSKGLKEENDLFYSLNAACHTDGLFIYIPPKLAVDAPLQIIHIIDEENSWMMPRLFFFQSTFSELTVAQTTHYKTNGKYLYNQMSEFIVEEGAKTQFVQNAFSSTHQKTQGFIFDDLHVELKKNSTFIAYQLTDGTATMRRKSTLRLLGEGADVHVNGIFLLDEEKDAHANILIEHKEPHTTSLQLYKSVLTDSARSSFQGKIFVHREAQKTQAYQLNSNLVLSDQAQANSKPNLEIFADDVKASHGATIGQLDQDELFYLKTRGFSEHDARRALISGFCQEVCDKIPNTLASLKTQAQERITQFTSH